MNQPKVNILLATYNGSKYLKKQLDSLLAQTYSNITIYIRDDCSTDDTVAFLKEYIAQNKSEKQIILLDNQNTNLRPPTSFYQILKECTPADYYAFCDQDDYWYPEKIEWAVQELEKHPSKDTLPLVYYSAYDYYTDKGEFIRHSPLQKEHPVLHDVLYYTPASGFLLVFNEQSRKRFFLDVDPGTEMHDRWLIRCCTCFGDIIYDKRYTATHIRHADAVTAEDSSNKNLLISFIKREIFGTAENEAKEHIAYFYRTFSSLLSSKDKQLLELFSGRNSFLKQCKKFFYPHRLRARLAGDIALRILFFIWKI